MKQDFKFGQSITFSSAGRAADGGAWELVGSPIVMEHVRMDLAEVVFSRWPSSEGGVCELGRMKPIRLDANSTRDLNFWQSYFPADPSTSTSSAS